VKIIKKKVRCPDCGKENKVRPHPNVWAWCTQCGTGYEVRDGKVTGVLRRKE